MFPTKLTGIFYNLSFFLNVNCMATQNNKAPVGAENSALNPRLKSDSHLLKKIVLFTSLKAF